MSKRNMFKGGFICLLSFFFIGHSSGQLLHVINDSRNPNHGEVYVADIDPVVIGHIRGRALNFNEWTSFFSIKVKGANRAVFGDYVAKNGQLMFKPKFVPDPELQYEVSFSGKELNSLLKLDIDLGDFYEEVQFHVLVHPVEVIKIEPAADTLPANLLRVYVTFSGPMGLENPYLFVNLLDHTGDTIAEPFVEFREGLWDMRRERLTLLMHPGRIKRGVGPNVAQGEILREGKSYQLVISNQWKSASGSYLAKSFKKTFFVSHDIRKKIDPDSWKWSLPATGSQIELRIKTNAILDEALAERFISLSRDGDLIQGIPKYNSSTKTWAFSPNQKWEPGSYEIMINSQLEDVSGNNLSQAFDYHSDERGDKSDFRKTFELK